MDNNEAWVQNTRQRVKSINAQIDTILNTLKWNRDDLKQWYSKEQEKLVCPHDQRHVLPRSKWQVHAEQCLAKKQNNQPPPPRPKGGAHVYPLVPSVDYATLANSIRAQHGLPSVARVQDFQQDQETLEHDQDDDGDDDDDDEQTKERDSTGIKRRRKTYRVKVSKHRSATEVQRQLVHGYMHEFQ
ncbi:hypothetical protein INT45_004754 [Circinella minor]|uniref:CHHC U11-48K-type domain-containing protein n=1 Tax=Circinella minor TaxID=1195481 RepID=A0A8H7SGI6_9FUNG|nr:hypothetical protein INT45_004754 [Circinella minor]